ncbi:MAG: cytochrome c peroxidase [Flavobacteriales bacterium]
MFFFSIFFFFSFSNVFGDVPEGSWILGLEPDYQIPKDNPPTQEKVLLGKRLFFDKRLSLDESMSCATCHVPEKGFSNAMEVAEGVSGVKGSRNVPSVVNRLFGQAQFWDGRSETLESQAVGPLLNPDEMGINEVLLTERLKAYPEYQTLFQKAFNSAPTLENVSKAIASFERTLITGESLFDRYEWNGETDALSASAKRGLTLFRGKARCSMCHIGTNFTDENFHNIGAGAEEGRKDPGRMQVTKDSVDSGKFKTPTLRNITLTAPYMHDGSIATLEDVIAFYDRGGGPNPNLDKEIKPLKLTDQEKADLLAFLKSLTGPVISVNVEDLKARTQ